MQDVNISTSKLSRSRLPISEVKVLSPTFEHHRPRDTLGIGESRPRISWRFDGATKNWKQTSYEIEVRRATAAASAHLIAECGPLVESNQSVLVPWPSDWALESGENVIVWVWVRGRGETGEDVSKSGESSVEAGLLYREDWKAQAIFSPKTLTTGDSLRPAYFRNAFELESNRAAVKRARLYITSVGVYGAWINGKKVGDHVLAPGWTSYKYRLQYQTFDVTDFMRTGKNAIGVEVGEGWFCGRLGFGGGQKCIYNDQLGVLAQLEIQFNDESTLTIKSNADWRTSVGPTISSQIYDGEECDRNLEIPGWNQPSFDAGNWDKVEVFGDRLLHSLVSPDGPPIRRIETVKAVNISTCSNETQKRQYIVDFGQNLVGWLKIKVSGPKGCRIEFQHGEVLEAGEVATRSLRHCKATDHLILSGPPIGDDYWEPTFTFHGFRYVQIKGWPEGSEPTTSQIQAVVIHTDMEPTEWSMRGNFVGIPTDCPQRDERLGWTGDIQIFSPTANLLYNTSGMLTGWLKDLAVEQLRIEKAGGVVGNVVPIIPDIDLLFTPQAAWSDAAIITPWDLYTASGDLKILTNQYESMVTWLGKGIPRQENGLWDPKCFQLGDWLDPDAPADDPGKGKTDPHLVANAYLAHVTNLMSQISDALGHKHDATRYDEEARDLKKLFIDQYTTSNGHLTPETMTSLALTNAFGLYPSPELKDAAAIRLGALVRDAKFRISTGFVGTPLILPVLTSIGKTDLAYRMLEEEECPSWLYPITMGATTMWERWDSMLKDGSVNPGEMTSFNHYALGSVGAWLHSTVAGISPLEPGWKKILMRPQPGGTITHAKGTFLSPYGLVKISWFLSPRKGWFTCNITVPPNCTAVVDLPYLQHAEGKEVGSGDYSFVHRYEGNRQDEMPPFIDPFTEAETDDSPSPRDVVGELRS